jgi:hypothetical protein
MSIRPAAETTWLSLDKFSWNCKFGNYVENFFDQILGLLKSDKYNKNFLHKDLLIFIQLVFTMETLRSVS